MTKITICRKWNNPQISINLTNEAISLEMSLDDFLVALADEVAEPLVNTIAQEAGNPSFWFTKNVLTKNLVKTLEGNTAHKHFVEATSRIIDTVKQETSKVI